MAYIPGVLGMGLHYLDELRLSIDVWQDEWWWFGQELILVPCLLAQRNN